jgi:hypothetical protein
VLRADHHSLRVVVYRVVDRNLGRMEVYEMIEVAIETYGSLQAGRAIQAYQHAMEYKPAKEKSEEEMRDERIRVKAPLPDYMGKHIDLEA